MSLWALLVAKTIFMGCGFGQKYYFFGNPAAEPASRIAVGIVMFVTSLDLPAAEHVEIVADAVEQGE